MEAGTVGDSAVIGALGGLIGLGGTEFRVPLLIDTFQLRAHQGSDAELGDEFRGRFFRRPIDPLT